MVTYFDTKKYAEETFAKNGIDKIESDLLFKYILNIDPIEFIINKNSEFLKYEELSKIINKRISGYPLQYIAGIWEFYGLPYKVGEGVLIPRPETEILVDLLIEKLCNKKDLKIADLCSGSGCIAISAAKKLSCNVSAFEISEEAIKYINHNIELNNTYNVKVIHGDVLDEKTIDLLEENYDAIVCNPPYLSKYDMENLQKEVKFEPELALYGGDDGYLFYSKLFRLWTQKLNTGGIFAVEIGMGQEKRTAEYMRIMGYEPNYIKDYNGIIRVLYGIKI